MLVRIDAFLFPNSLRQAGADIKCAKRSRAVRKAAGLPSVIQASGAESSPWNSCPCPSHNEPESRPFMAGRILNRRELRRQADAADQTAPPATDEAAAPVADAPKKAAKPKAAPKPRTPRKKKEAVRMCVR